MRFACSAVGLAAALALAGALGACESPAGKVSVLQSSSTPLVPGSTYAWAPVDEHARAAADPRVANDIIQERLRTAVDAAMGSKGYRLSSDPGTATLLVAYHVGLENKQETQVSSFGGGGAVACGFRGCVQGWGMYGPPMVDVQNINYTEGTLILDLVDRASGKLAWRGTSQKRVAQDPTQERINAVLADMTKTMPGSGAAK
jgi:hypothetical protein